ncbi:UNVERIFIED_CONTAM: hypothetical protein K2H54_057536 [Gekko kuhli]
MKILFCFPTIPPPPQPPVAQQLFNSLDFILTVHTKKEKKKKYEFPCMETPVLAVSSLEKVCQERQYLGSKQPILWNPALRLKDIIITIIIIIRTHLGRRMCKQKGRSRHDTAVPKKESPFYFVTTRHWHSGRLDTTASLLRSKKDPDGRDDGSSSVLIYGKGEGGKAVCFLFEPHLESLDHCSYLQVHSKHSCLDKQGCLF